MLTTAYKPKIIKFKIDEDPIQSRIYLLTFIESLEIIFSQYKETCEVLLDYLKIEGDDINDYVKNSISNILHANFYVHGRRLISKFPGDGVKCISKFQSHCRNITFAGKSRHDRLFRKATHKRGESLKNYIKRF